MAKAGEILEPVSNIGVPDTVLEHGTNIEIEIARAAIEEYLQDELGPEWWRKIYRGDVPFDLAIEYYWSKRLPL